jgi:hypothetical protein
MNERQKKIQRISEELMKCFEKAFQSQKAYAIEARRLYPLEKVCPCEDNIIEDTSPVECVCVDCNFCDRSPSDYQ